jgi:alkylated DNA nucleotide flippase Atl1
MRGGAVSARLHDGPAGELLAKAEAETKRWVVALLDADGLPWWRVLARHRLRATAERHRERAVTLVCQSAEADR